MGFYARAVALAALLGAGRSADPSPRTCEPIRAESCRNIGYNFTGMPNLARHTMQADADATMLTFSPLIQYGCSHQLHLFLCSVYFPMCTDKVALPIGPCRGLCESVYARCFPVLEGFGFPWPPDFDCSRFPAENNHEHMCMEGPGEPAAAAGPGAGPGAGAPESAGAGCRQYARAASYAFLPRSGRCAQYCEAEVLHDAGERRLAEVWLGTWAGLCVLSALAGVLGAGGAARALLPLALCHGLAAVGWGVRAVAGRAAVACSRDAQSPSRPVLSQDGLANPNCAVVFLLLYYFGMAASVWWVVLAGTWRARVLRRAAGAPATAPQSSPLQLAAWGLPAAQTVAVLVLRDVDADELTGTCFVGNQSTSSLLTLVIVPQLIYLIAGCVLLVLGFRALLRTPEIPLQQAPHRKEPSEDVHLLRLGIFAVMYIIPESCVIASRLYEYFCRDGWLAAVGPSPVPVVSPKPAVWIFLLRIFMLQISGVMTSVWILSPKVMAGWKRLCGRMGPPAYKPAPLKLSPPALYYAPAPPPKRPHGHPHSAHPHAHRKPRSHHAHSLPHCQTML